MVHPYANAAGYMMASRETLAQEDSRPRRTEGDHPTRGQRFSAISFLNMSTEGFHRRISVALHVPDCAAPSAPFSAADHALSTALDRAFVAALFGTSVAASFSTSFAPVVRDLLALFDSVLLSYNGGARLPNNHRALLSYRDDHTAHRRSRPSHCRLRRSHYCRAQPRHLVPRRYLVHVHPAHARRPAFQLQLARPAQRSPSRQEEALRGVRAGLAGAVARVRRAGEGDAQSLEEADWGSRAQSV
ncbi:hypothetical protein HDZ31DRAFT_63407 [Schizophyllum fasciatum]